MPSLAMAAATSRLPPTVMPFSRAACPARWMTGPSASGSEWGTPISSAAMPDVASLFPTSIDFLRLGWPAIMYATSFRSLFARSATSRRGASDTIYGVHVLVAPTRKADKNAPARPKLARDQPRVVQRMRGLERGHDAFQPRAQLERRNRVFVGDGDV